MFRFCIAIVVAAIYVHLSFCNYSSEKNKGKYEAVLEYVQYCKDPQPPDAKNITLISKYSIVVVNGKKMLTGNTTITAPTPFLNFSARSYSIDRSGKRVIRFQISQVSCRNILAKSIIMYSNITMSTKTCFLHKGFYQFSIDLNKVTHGMPGWHAPGDLIHELQLVIDGATAFCTEVKVKIG